VPPRATIPLDSFDLQHLIGEGGMGQVWQAAHRDSATRVAVKLIRREAFADRTSLEQFQQEVRAVARLNHPAIVLVYDHGVAGADTEAASRGQIAAGSPYLVMELSTGGTLAERSPQSWPEVAGVLRSLLDALAHAHARGVVHRDIKLSNILLSGPGDPRPGLKLSDFGAAHDLAIDESMPEEVMLVGTAYYTPPEQVLGRWRDFGPWTDLYALGVLVWRLVSGRYPFEHENLTALFGMHVRTPPPLLRPLFDVPDGLDAWLRRLLAKDPMDRFRRAADAAWAMECMGGEGWTTAPELSAVENPYAPQGTQALEQLTGLASSFADPAAATAPLPRPVTPSWGPPEQGPEPEPPPLPETWRRRESTPVALQLGSAGVGLYGLRPPPLVGRVAERDLLWSALRAVVDGGGPTAVALEGYAGLGKTHLARWIAERAHELGNATVLPVFHGPTPGRLPPVLRMVEGYFGVGRLPKTHVGERVEAVLARLGCRDEWEVDAITELLRPAGPDDERPAVRLGGPAERYALVERLLARQSRRRPIILLVEDAQWGLDALGLVNHLLDSKRPDPLRVLVVLTVRRRIGDARTAEWRELEALFARPDVQQVPVGLLPLPDLLKLVRELLGLGSELAHEVTARAGGSPTFATQLVQDWIVRGLLVPGGDGFALRPGARTELPDDIHALWTDLLERVFSNFPPRARIGLELAACLGRHVDDGEWREACERQGIRVPERLRDALIERNFAVRTDQGWAFSHGLIQESLERSAEEAGRLRDHHRICVEVLRHSHAPPGRLGRHLLASGQEVDGVDALLAASDRAWDADDYLAAGQLLSQRERVLERIEHPPEDRRWGLGWERRALVRWRMGDLEGGWEIADRAVVAAEAHGWPDVAARALAVQARMARYQGRIDDALALAERALDHARTQGDGRGIARSERVLARVLSDRGQFDDARTFAESARATFESMFDVAGVIDCERTLYSVARQTGDLVEAGRIAEDLRGIQELRGHRWGLAHALESLGEVARYQGRLDDAEAHYRQADALFRAVNEMDPRAHATTLNLGMVLMAQGRPADAEELVRGAVEVFERHHSRALLGLGSCVLAGCLAALGRWSECGDELTRGSEILAAIGFADVDIALVALDAAGAARTAGEEALADRLFEQAGAWFEQLGRADEAAAARALRAP